MATLIYLMGPSGAGKDSLLERLRAVTGSGPLVAHRYITRPANAGCENHIALSEQEFLRRRAKGLFALDWQAHQQRYAFGIEVDLWLLQGSDVVVNGSRAHLPQALQRYGSQLLPVCLQVSTAVLRQRLEQRGGKHRPRSNNAWREPPTINKPCRQIAACWITMAILHIPWPHCWP